MSPRLTIILSAALLASGCTITSDLGHPCVLQKSVQRTDPETGQPVTVVEDILEKELTPGQDFVAFGVTDCEDLICVRDAATPIILDDPNTTVDESNVSASGYCSKACVQDSGDAACEVTDSEATDDLKSRMGCRSLLLDQATLDALRASDPAYYRATFGDTNSPYFCAGKLPPAASP